MTSNQMNPYEPSQVTELASSRKPISEYISQSVPSIGLVILRDWLGRLWIYNGVLAIVFLSFWATENVSWRAFDYGLPFVFLNTGFLVGPFLEWLITKKRQQRVNWGPALFVLYLVIGVLCLLVFIAIANLQRFGM